MPIQVDRLKSDFKARIRLLDSGKNPVTGIEWDAADLEVEILAESGSGFTAQSIVSGEVGSFQSNSWAEINDGWYQYCIPNSYMVPDTQIVIRARGRAVDPWGYGIVMTTGSRYIDMDQPTPAGSTVGAQLDKLVDQSTTSSPTPTQNATRQYPTSTLFEAEVAEEFYTGADWSQEFNDVGIVTIADVIEYSLKSDLDDSDEEAVLTVRIPVNGKARVTRLNGALVHFESDVAGSYREYIDVDDNNTTKQKVVLFIRDTITSQVPAGTYHRGLKVVGDSRVILQDTISVDQSVIRAYEV